MQPGWAPAAARTKKSRCCSEPLGQFCLSPANWIRPPRPRCIERKGAGRRTRSLRGECRDSQAFNRASLQGLLHPAVLCGAGKCGILPKDHQSPQQPELEHSGFPKAQIRRVVVDQGAQSRLSPLRFQGVRSSCAPAPSRRVPPTRNSPALTRASARRCAWPELEPRPRGSGARSWSKGLRTPEGLEEGCCTSTHLEPQDLGC